MFHPVLLTCGMGMLIKRGKERRLFSPFCISVFAEDDYFNQILLSTVKRSSTAKVISFSERILDRKERVFVRCDAPKNLVSQNVPQVGCYTFFVYE